MVLPMNMKLKVVIHQGNLKGSRQAAATTKTAGHPNGQPAVLVEVTGLEPAASCSQMVKNT